MTAGPMFTRKPKRAQPAAAAAEPTGQDSVYRALFVRHFHAMVRLAALLGADDPEDIAQEAFLRLHEHLDDVRESTATLAYLRRITSNLATSRTRHLKVVRRTPGETRIDATSAEDQVLTGIRVDELLAAVRRLSPRPRQVLILRYWMDLPLAEVAAALDMRLGTVKSTLTRAQRALATDLEHRI